MPGRVAARAAANAGTPGTHGRASSTYFGDVRRRGTHPDAPQAGGLACNGIHARSGQPRSRAAVTRRRDRRREGPVGLAGRSAGRDLVPGGVQGIADDPAPARVVRRRSRSARTGSRRDQIGHDRASDRPDLAPASPRRPAAGPPRRRRRRSRRRAPDHLGRRCPPRGDPQGAGPTRKATRPSDGPWRPRGLGFRRDRRFWPNSRGTCGRSCTSAEGQRRGTSAGPPQRPPGRPRLPPRAAAPSRLARRRGAEAPERTPRTEVRPTRSLYQAR